MVQTFFIANNLLQNTSFLMREDSKMEHDTSNNSGMNNEESIIIVPGSNYSERVNESMYSDESQSYRNRRFSTVR